MINEQLSTDIRNLIDKGTYEEFKKLIESESIDPDERLFSKRESSCWPMLNYAVREKFNNRNYTSRLQIANYLIKNGCNINDNYPYGFSPLTSLLNTHYYLRTSKAKYDVFLQTLIFALEMVRQPGLDVNLMDKETSGILDAALEVQEYHSRSENEELLKISTVIIKELIEKGAKLEKGADEYKEESMEFIKGLGYK